MPESTQPLLIEIGCEEIPSRIVAGLAREFASRLDAALDEAGLAAATGEAHWTPRRLIYRHSAVANVQPERTEQVLGPPVRVAVAKDGSYTPQALGFASKNQAQGADLFRVTTPKGEYIAVNRKQGGAPASELLAAMIPAALTACDLPRSMRWQGEFRFIRPVRWLLALLGETQVSFTLGELESGETSRGHRTLGAARFPVFAAGAYPERWESNCVIPDAAARQARLLAAADRALAGAGQPGLRLRADASLLDTLVNLTEFTDAILGAFDASYIKALPPEVLVTVMRDHQKYFAVEDVSARLAPFFIAIINQDGDPHGLIRHGNERVLRARFSDAQFFWDADRKLTLKARLPLLEQVTFQAKLGSYRQKSVRMRTLAGWLASQWQGCDRGVAETAAELAKCDLTTEMVKEFTELQGIMGGHYARAEGLPEPVAVAIADQYVWDSAPGSPEAAAVSIADKLDTLAGMFAIGEIPTGSADPFALRRAANGLIRALIGRRLTLSLSAACDQALAAYGAVDAFRPLAQVKSDLLAFLNERLGFHLRESENVPVPVVAAVLAIGADDALDALARAQALAAAPDLAGVAAVVKRARSIVRKEKWTSSDVNPSLLSADAEKSLRQAVESLPADGAYAPELAAIANLAAPLDRFFTEVRVNDPDPAVRANRLSLLASTVARLSRIADFSELAG